MPDPLGAAVSADIAAVDTLPVARPAADAEERGRLKRRRNASHSLRRASSPSRGHDRNSGSRYRQHHRKHHRPSSPASSVSPPTVAQKKTRRRSDAEPDHTFRGRARNRSGSRRRTRSPLLEDEDLDAGSEDGVKSLRKRSAPPSRPRADQVDESERFRRQRSYPNLYKQDRKDPKEENEKKMDGVKTHHVTTEAIAAAVQMV